MAGNAAELKLNVTLDLAFFRGQLANLAQVTSGYRLPINVSIDRRGLQNELNALGANIRQRNYRLNIQTNLQAEIKAAKELAAEMAKLSGGAGGTIPRKGGTFRQELQNLDTAQIQQIYAAAAKAGLVAFDNEINREKGKIITALNQAANDAGQGFLNAFKNQNSSLRKAAGDYGNALLDGLRKTLRIESPSKEMFNIGEDAGKGFELGLLRSMELAEQSATRRMRRMLDRLARIALMASGMSAAEINRQAGQFQGGTTVGAPFWAATVPPSMGGGGGGRLLPPGPTFAALGGSAFGSQKYLPTDLSAELKQILKGAAFAFVDAIKQEIRGVRVGLAGPSQNLLTPGRIAGLLPSAVGRQPQMYSTQPSQAEIFSRRTAEAYRRSALRGVDVLAETVGRAPQPYSYSSVGREQVMQPQRAIVPYASPGAIVPAVGGAGGGGGGRGRGIASGFFDGMGGQIGGGLLGANLPGARSIRELGAEFGNATKQVLLFGTAYKALAFLMDFPSQVGAAVGSLQSFRNTLSAISPTAEEARASNAKILELVDKYNIPLASARDGFTKLYASMQPAGFSGEEIRTLFEGISKGAATFGMSADKVDRVNYAFAQMASKGQVMSEELKGQLGDVLPGAMAIFAEAAGFKGPKAIQDFSAALEEGRYKGDAMRQLLINVGSVMNQEFGPGAEGAARTFQGSINRMQNSLLNLYQAFEPVAVGFLNGVVTPLTGGLKTLTDGFTAFFTGTAAKTSGGFAIAEQLQQLKPSFDGILRNLQQLTPVFKTFLETAGALGRVFVQVAGTPFAGYLLRVYASVLPLTIAIRALNLQALIPLIASLVRSVPAFIAMATAAMQGSTTLGTVRAVMAATGVSASVAAGQVRTFSLALRTAFATTVIGAVLVGIGMLIEKFAMMGAKLDEVRAKAQGASQAIRAMTSVEAKTEQSNRERIARDLRSLQGQQSLSLGNKEVVQVSAGMAKRFEEAGIPVRSDLTGRQFLEKSTIPGQILQQTRLAGEARFRQEQLAFEEKQVANLTKLPSIPAGDGDSKGGKLASYYSDTTKQLQNQLAIDINTLDLQKEKLQISETQYELRKAQLQFDTESKIIEEQKTLALKQANKENLSAFDLARKKKDIERDAASANAKARSDLNKAQASARIQLEAPITRAIIDETAAIDKQQVLMSNYTRGIAQLSAAQEAELAIRELTKDKGQDEIALMKEQYDVLQDLIKARIENNRLVEQEANLAGLRAQAGVAGAGLGAGFIGEAGGAFEKALLESQGNVDYAMQMARLTEQLSLLKLNADLTRQSIEGIGGAFATTLVDGSMALAEGSKTAQEVFADFLRSIAKILADAAKQIIATYIAIGIARMFAGIRGGGGGGGLEAYTPQGNAAFMERTGALGFANGGIVMGGFKAFADGGVVTGPTLGLVGEGRYNEAIIPMPNGRSVPVDLQGAAGGNTNVVVNVDAKGSAASGDETRANAFGRVIANAVQEEIIRQKRPGGLLTQ